MEFVSIEELAALAKLNRRTIDRKLRALKLVYPDRYKELTKKEGKKLFYNANELIGYMNAGIKPVGPLPPNATIKDVPIKGMRTKLTHLKKKRSKPKKTEEQKQKQRDKNRTLVTDELLNEPEIIELDEDLRSDFKNLDARDQRNMLSFAAAMHDYETGLSTLQYCMDAHGISMASFYRWIDSKPMFKALYAKSTVKHKKAYNSKLHEAAKEALMKMVTGYDKDMSSTVYLQRVGPNGQVILIPTERKTQQKHIIPNVNAIMFALTNRDPEDWKRILTPGAMPEKPQDPLEQMTDQQLMDMVEQAKQQGLIGTSENTP